MCSSCPRSTASRFAAAAGLLLALVSCGVSTDDALAACSQLDGSTTDAAEPPRLTTEDHLQVSLAVTSESGTWAMRDDDLISSSNYVLCAETVEIEITGPSCSYKEDASTYQGMVFTFDATLVELSTEEALDATMLTVPNQFADGPCPATLAVPVDREEAERPEWVKLVGAYLESLATPS